MVMPSDNQRGLKKRVSELLKLETLDRALSVLNGQPVRKATNALFSFLPSTDPKVRWAAVTAMGLMVSRFTDRQMEQARVVMRRLMWQLNDESGGIGWGCPEAMGEIMASHESLANEFAHILVSYVRKDGNFLEYQPLQQGVIWGIARLAQVRPQLVKDAVPHLVAFLQAGDATLRGLTVWALGMLGERGVQPEIKCLARDSSEVEIFVDRKLVRCQVKELADKAITQIDKVQQ